MFTIIQSPDFRKWLMALRDRKARLVIDKRLLRIEMGNLGDIKPVGAGVNEARIDYAAGYRLYFIRRDKTIIVMLAGGDKSSQPRDIERAKALAQEWREQ